MSVRKRPSAGPINVERVFKRPSVSSHLDPSSELCWYFLNGECQRGDTCHYLHNYPCWYFQNGGCNHGDNCQLSHVGVEVASAGAPLSPAESTAQKDRFAAGVRFVVDRSLGDFLMWKSGLDVPCRLPIGPVRLRLVGDLQCLGRTDEGQWNPQDGADLFWEGHRWTSLVMSVTPQANLQFGVVAVDQDPICPGLLLGPHRRAVHKSRRYTSGKIHCIHTPAVGQVLEVFVNGPSCNAVVRPRYEMIAQSGLEFPGPAPSHAGKQRCYSFEDPSGDLLNFSLYVPTSYQAAGDREWPLVLFLHSMHCSIDRDNNLFYESDTPLWLLQTNSSRCPRSLREECLLLAPVCREESGTIWLRDGWFLDSHHNPDKEAAIYSLIDSVARTCRVDRRRISVVGSSMGGYAALELSKRWPKFFAAAGLAASYYEFDPVDLLIARLAEDAIPLWFFHATNDTMCPYEDIEAMVSQLRCKSKAEVRFTSYLDTWSISGHHVDPVAFFAPDPESAAVSESSALAQGEDLFSWLTAQRLGD